ncbi:hypothetical protein Ssi03_21850 [Sphaerisporangium siamense]|uniref:PIG-L deacetylase family protein n=1 Tax=Sphaerisporangium siamense TaxID=795645 RepID=UPI001A3726AD|nr:PIG-L family deacetylase [Sphaerisporangium siamense]GII84195.1 hypothetical protein Ssi03_21850 [Sphaerisporangium siamense]
MSGRLVLSPHPDDAVWSIGGCIARWRRAGEPVTVLTVFDGPPNGPIAGLPSDMASGTAEGAAGVTTEDWRRVAEPAVRREEDRRALAAIDAGGVSVGLPDAALRTSDNEPRYSRVLSLFGRPHPDDHTLPAAIAAAIHAHLAPGDALYAPLAAGNHIDHRLVRAAVESDPTLRARTTWYEDVPYKLAPRDTAGLHPRYEPIDPADLEAWIAAAVHYESQAEAVLGGTRELRAHLTGRVEPHGGAIRLWSAPAA